MPYFTPGNTHNISYIKFDAVKAVVPFISNGGETSTKSSPFSEAISNASEIETLANSVIDNGGLTFISALSGLGAPYWDPNATGSILGITTKTNKGHIARAALEAIAIRSYEIISNMEKDSEIKFSL